MKDMLKNVVDRKIETPYGNFYITDDLQLISGELTGINLVADQTIELASIGIKSEIGHSNYPAFINVGSYYPKEEGGIYISVETYSYGSKIILDSEVNINEHDILYMITPLNLIHLFEHPQCAPSANDNIEQDC